MNKTELREIIINGEDSGVEFKRDDVHMDSLAKEFLMKLCFATTNENVYIGGMRST